MCGPTQNLGPIGSAIFTFTGYKRTYKHPNGHAKYIYIYNKRQVEGREEGGYKGY